ncbi:MAG: bifunctional aspartate kinase/diaminopimelate decarboxylase, partial [Pseudomonadota bacterium]
SDEANYLNASCQPRNTADAPGLPPAAAYLTQGFVARNAQGETVVLGRGGSDTSASYFAAQLGAERVEIWTDVAGMFSADPRRVPTAHLLKQLDYSEAQEIASTGARVLHPRCIGPARERDIPMHIRSTMAPNLTGTLISRLPGSDDARLKAVSARRGVTLVSMDTAGMWQQPGFLARAFGLFAQHGLSVDLVSTSQTNVTVSLDPTGRGDGASLERLVGALAPLSRVTLVRECAAISLVGRRVRAILHQLAPALDVFREFEVHLVSQSANDLNFTFVVNEIHADKLVQRLHDLLIHRSDEDDPVMGERGGAGAAPEAPAHAWWLSRREELLALAPEDAPRYVYSRDALTRNARRLRAMDQVDRVLYASKANAHPEVLGTLADVDVDIECVSVQELEHALASVDGLGAQRCLFTPNFARRQEYERAFALGATVTIDNPYVLAHWGEALAGRDVLLRVDPGQGRGHHRFVRTAGKRSKFGVPLDAVAEIDAMARAAGARIVGLHAHKGSGITDASTWAHTARTLAKAASHVSTATVLNLGGGLGVPDTLADPVLDLEELNAALAAVREDFPGYALWLEPGRFLVADAGVLLTRVTQVKRKDGITFVGVNAGMHSLIRPALYGAYHHMVNLTRLSEPATECVDVVGPICESADVLGKARFLAPCQEGDVILIAN